MRMWNINPVILCRKHLLGEHLEMHMFVGSIKKERNIKGYIKNGLVEIHNIINRHDILVMEMNRRNMNHKSPIEIIELWNEGYVNIKENEKILFDRCHECYRNYVRFMSSMEIREINNEKGIN